MKVVVTVTHAGVVDVDDADHLAEVIQEFWQGNPLTDYVDRPEVSVDWEPYKGRGQ